MLTFKEGKEEFRPQKTDEMVSIVIAGDVCPWHTALEPVKNGASSEILRGIQPHLDAADLSVVQWETPLTNDETPIPKSGPNLKCPPECVDFAIKAGFDVALLANNHTGDYGTASVMETINILEKNGIKTVGAGKNQVEAQKPLFMQIKGIDIAFVNFAENEFGTAGRNKAGCAPLNPLDNIKTIKEASSKADICLVIIHGGNEHNPVPSPRMVNTYRAFADAGASAVINIHAHCPQGIEYYNDVPIIYCPGNFFFPSIWQEYNKENFWWTGYLPELSFDKEGAFSLKITPYSFTQNPCAINVLSENESNNFYSYLAEISAIITDENKLQDYFDAWCALTGPEQLAHLRMISAYWPVDYNDPENRNTLLPLRNHFTCEAHNELKNNFLRMIEEERINEAEKLIPELKRLQNAGIPD